MNRLLRWGAFGVLTTLLVGVAPPEATAGHTLMRETFEGPFPAVGWETTASTAEVRWLADDEPTAGPFDGGYADADAQLATGPYDASLITPTVHLPDAQRVYAAFDCLFETWTGFETADLDLYAAGAWTNLRRWTHADLDEGTLRGPVTVEFTEFAGADVRLRFRYYHDLSGLGAATFFGDLYWRVDDLEIAVDNLIGDANDDGRVNLNDFVILKNNFGSTGATWATGDFDGDGSVNLNDFVLLKNNFGASVAGP